MPLHPGFRIFILGAGFSKPAGLTTHDTILTFNYDILLERALDHIGKPYRLFPYRFQSVSETINIIDSSIEEVVILKMHGSVDWFNNHPLMSDTIDSIFNNPDRFCIDPIIKGLRPDDDPLLHIHRIRNLDVYYGSDDWTNVPFILSPSHAKFVYATPLLGFWNGMGRSGGYNLGISIIGFSLPKHDEYIRVGLYQMISHYQQSWWKGKMLDVLKDNVRLVDYRSDEKDIRNFKTRFSFIDPSRTNYFFSGFNTEAIKFLFEQPRETL